MFRRVFAILLVLAAVAASSGCSLPGSSDRGEGSLEQVKALRVGLVTDTGGLEDRSFNSLAVRGLARARSELGVQTKVLVSETPADYGPNLAKLAREGYDLVIGVGFMIAPAVDRVAERFPDTKFAVVDNSTENLRVRNENVQGTLFDEKQGGYLAGYVTGLFAIDNKIDQVSVVGGRRIPPVQKYVNGFRSGVRAINPELKVAVDYSNDFVNEAPCRKIAERQISWGSRVVFQVAGKCGLGALEAAKEAGAFGVGVDADQSYLGDFILTSATKKVDVATFETIRGAQNGEYLGGSDITFNVFNNGVGIGTLGPGAVRYRKQVEAIQSELVNGQESIQNRQGR